MADKQTETGAADREALAKRHKSRRALTYGIGFSDTPIAKGPRVKEAEEKIKKLDAKYAKEAEDEIKRETRGMKKGGSVKSSASKRADGIAMRGKTKGRMV